MTTTAEGPRWADPSRCPDCRAQLVGTGRCPACGLVLDGPDAVRLFELLSEADGVLARMRARTGADAAPAAPRDGLLPGMQETGAPPSERPRRSGLRLPSATVPTVLLGLGAVLLSVAVLVFAAFTWFLLPELGRAVLLLGVAAAAGMAAWRVSRRGLRIAAEALWPLSLFVALVGLQLVGPDTGDAGAAWTFFCGVVLVLASVAAARALQRQELAVPVLLETAVILLATVAVAGLSDLDPTLPLVSSGVSLCVLALALALAFVALRSGLRLVAGISVAATAFAWLTVVGAGATRLATEGLPAWSPARYADLLVAIAIAVALAYAPLPSGAGLPPEAARRARQVGAGAAAVVLVLLGALSTFGSRVPFSAEPHLNAAALVASALLLMIATIIAVGRPTAGPGPAQTPRGHRVEGLVAAWAIVSGAAVLLAVVMSVTALIAVGDVRRRPGDLGVADTVMRDGATWWWALVVLVGVAASTLPRVLAGAGGLTAVVRDVGRALAPSALLVLAALCAVAPRGPVWAVVALLVATVLVSAAAAWTDRADRARADLVVLASVAGILLYTASVSPVLMAGSSALVAVIAGAMTLAGAQPDPLRTALAAAVAPLAVASAAATGLPLLAAGPLACRLVAVSVAGAWVAFLSVRRQHAAVRSAAGLAGLAVVLGLAADRPAGEVSWVLLVGGLAAVLTTILTPTDDSPGWVGSALLLGATAARDAAGGPPPELLSLSAAAVLIALGAWQLGRRPEASSVRLLGPALTLALLPTLLLALAEPIGVRSLLIAALATAALAWGALAGLAAPLVLGAGSLLLLGLRLLEPIATTVPWWLVAGVLGTALLVIGATWEARRAEVDAAVRYVRRLR